MRIACEKPVVIFHPNVLSHLYNAVLIHYPTHTTELRSDDVNEIYTDSHGYLVSHFPPCRNVDNPDDYYIVDDNGEIFPVYMQVPCNECPCCIATRMNSYKQQLEFELLDSVNYPGCTNLFVTFTYRDKFLPYRKSLDKPGFQRFIKRLRKLVRTELSPEDSQNIKVLYSGEYGTISTKRPHYHCCFLHFPLQKLAEKYDEAHARLIFEYCWSEKPNGNAKDSLPFSQYNVTSYGNLNLVSSYFYKKYVIGIVKVCNILNGHLGSYVAKYVTKSSKKRVDGASKYVTKSSKKQDDNYNYRYKFLTKSSKKDAGYKTPCYVCKSRHFGVNFLYTNVANEVYKNKKNRFHYLDLDGIVQDKASLCSYYIGKLFPTISRLIPSDIRKAIHRIKDIRYELQRRCYKQNTNYTILFKNIPFFGVLHNYVPTVKYTQEWHDEYGKNIIKNICNSSKSLYLSMLNDISEVSSYFTDEFLGYLNDMKKMRDEFLYNTFQEMPSISAQMDCLKRQYRDMKLSIKL